MRLYHGSQNAIVEPKYGLGQDHHDFGRGFYLTDREDLAKEWSVYRPRSMDGWLHADSEARRKMHELIADPQFNRLDRLFNDLIREA